jgi:DNA mismatch endonuclease, patch repair protein
LSAMSVGTPAHRKYWVPKLERNKSRDARVQKELAQLGWRVLVVWECQATDSRVLNTIARKIAPSATRHEALSSLGDAN